jgi:integrase
MLIAAVDHYLSTRRALGFKLVSAGQRLRKFARFAAARGEDHVRVATALAWAAQAPSPHARHIRCRDLRRFARFAHAEDPLHEDIVGDPLPHLWRRPLPHIYTADEIARILAATGAIHETFPMKRQIVATFAGLVAATGLRFSEALRLRLDDVHPDGHLVVRMTKFRKSRLVPLHATVREALSRYIARRRRRKGANAYLFPASRGNGHVSEPTIRSAFRKAQEIAGIGKRDGRLPRIHDLRHTFATRSLERCAHQGKDVARHHLALTTYLGHASPQATFWYLQATPSLMQDTSAATEALMWTAKP